MVDAWLVRGYKTAVEQANDAKVARIALPTRSDLYAQARRRVQRSPRLRRYESILLADWPEGDDHLRCVIRWRVRELESRARIMSSPDDEAATHRFNAMKILLDRIHTRGLEHAGKVPAGEVAVEGGDDD
jgi:hypothetical protein